MWPESCSAVGSVQPASKTERIYNKSRDSTPSAILFGEVIDKSLTEA